MMVPYCIVNDIRINPIIIFLTIMICICCLEMCLDCGRAGNLPGGRTDQQCTFLAAGGNLTSP